MITENLAEPWKYIIGPYFVVRTKISLESLYRHTMCPLPCLLCLGNSNATLLSFTLSSHEACWSCLGLTSIAAAEQAAAAEPTVVVVRTETIQVQPSAAMAASETTLPTIAQMPETEEKEQ